MIARTLARIEPSWRAPLALLAVLWAAAALLFAADVADMARLWWDSSTYNHILFIPFLIGWLVAQRAGLIAPLLPRPWWPGAALMLGAGAVWLLGEAGGVALLRHLGVVLMLQAAVVTALGPLAARALAFPLAYALFLVPFGDELVPGFQALTADLTMLLLDISGTQATRDGIFIATASGLFEVAEECAGVMFLVAMAAFATLAAHLCFAGWARRIIFVAAALATTIVANALRAFGTILVAETFGIEYAAGVDHIIYGWFFFAFIMAAVMLVARRWFDRPASDPAVDVGALTGPVRGAGAALPVGLAAAAALLAAPLWAAQIGARSGTLPAIVTLPTVPGWTMGGTPDPVWKARFDGADHFLQRRYTDAAGRSVDVALALYARQGEGREVIGFGQGAADPDSGWRIAAPIGTLAGAAVQPLFLDGVQRRETAHWFIVGGALTADPRRAKLAGLTARLLGGDPRATAIVLSSQQGRAAMHDWLDAAGGVRKVADPALETR